MSDPTLCVDTDELRSAADDVGAAVRDLEALPADRGMRNGASAMPGSLLAQALTHVGADLDRLLGAVAWGWQGWVAEVKAGGHQYVVAETEAAARHGRLNGGPSGSPPRPV